MANKKCEICKAPFMDGEQVAKNKFTHKLSHQRCVQKKQVLSLPLPRFIQATNHAKKLLEKRTQVEETKRGKALTEYRMGAEDALDMLFNVLGLDEEGNLLPPAGAIPVPNSPPLGVELPVSAGLIAAPPMAQEPALEDTKP
jgi:hypothetical protein